MEQPVTTDKPAPAMPHLLTRLGTMTSIRDTHLLEQSLLRTLGPLLGVPRLSLYRVDDNLEIIHSLHYSRTLTPQGQDTEHVAEHIEEIRNEQNVPKTIGFLIKNISLTGNPSSIKTESGQLIGYPLHGNKVVQGYFICERNQSLSTTEDATIRGVLEVFTNYYALLDTSMRDRLTGLLNRYALELNLDRLWNLLIARQHESVPKNNRRDNDAQMYWLGVIDVDHFKKVNDTYGHIMGDEVLLVIARLLAASIRRSDLLYRYGGEEFVVIIAASDQESAEQVFERARLAVEQHVFPQVGQVTISGGFSAADPGVLPQTVTNRADRALYQAKDDGRNRMYNFETLTKKGVLSEVGSGEIELF